MVSGPLGVCRPVISGSRSNRFNLYIFISINMKDVCTLLYKQNKNGLQKLRQSATCLKFLKWFVIEKMLRNTGIYNVHLSPIVISRFRILRQTPLFLVRVRKAILIHQCVPQNVHANGIHFLLFCIKMPF